MEATFHWLVSFTANLVFAPIHLHQERIVSINTSEEEQAMIGCVDVDYRTEGALAACVLFEQWTDGTPTSELVEWISPVADYEPGQFYRRELPCLLAVLNRVATALEAIVVDGYVWLQGTDRPGLGAHLHEALGRQVPVIGVAKTRFLSATAALPVVRGDSQRPLWVTAVGIDSAEAARRVQSMHGVHRLPTLLKRVDRLCRETPRPLSKALDDLAL